jgi:predicted transcriptional regulator
MSTISLRLPDSLHDQVRELAKQENVSINQFITLALAEKISGSRDKFEQAMAKVADVEPLSQDVL